MIAICFYDAKSSFKKRENLVAACLRANLGVEAVVHPTKVEDAGLSAV